MSIEKHTFIPCINNAIYPWEKMFTPFKFLLYTNITFANKLH